MMFSGEVAAVSSASVPCLELARHTIQAQKAETKFFRTGSIRQEGLDRGLDYAGLTVYDSPSMNCHQPSAFSSLNY